MKYKHYTVHYRGKFVENISATSKKSILDNYRMENAIAGYRKFMLKLIEIKLIDDNNDIPDFSTDFTEIMTGVSLEEKTCIIPINRSDIKVGNNVVFYSGNYSGLSGIVTKVDFNRPDCIFGYLHTVMLSNGKTGYIEKSEHYSIINHETQR